MLETLDVPGPIVLNIWNEGILKDFAYPDKLELADVSPVNKKNPLSAETIDPWVFCQQLLKYLKD